MLEEPSNTEESEDTLPPAYLEALRNEARGALMARKRADARVSLGRLVAMSGDEDDRRNLAELIKGVELELQRYTGENGSIKKRLQDGTTLDAIQQELSSRISHWRAFTNDLPELALARDGLPAHEDPETKRKLKDLEKRLAEGAVQEVLESWIELGQPEAAAGGVFVQVLNAFAGLGASLEKRDWKGANERVAGTKQLLETEEGMPYRSACLPQAHAMEENLRWELLLIKCASSSGLTGRERNRLLVELSRAENDIDFRLRDNPALDEIQARIKVVIEDFSAALPEEEEPRSLAKPLVAVLVLIVLVLIALWIYFRSITPGGSTDYGETRHQGLTLSHHRKPEFISISNT